MALAVQPPPPADPVLAAAYEGDVEKQVCYILKPCRFRTLDCTTCE
ncbi:hypothetical protein MAR_021561 [Mya arenaria]|uniref:Uncharacterized protein n=1 Tax=Mya arenaria TaxID=6604 RepID=A0ABY7EBM5_MYAAR|nr:hypothetical protein MAR_021561 [Mya arenaria]